MHDGATTGDPELNMRWRLARIVVIGEANHELYRIMFRGARKAQWPSLRMQDS
jgi:hypothetical protein